MWPVTMTEEGFSYSIVKQPSLIGPCLGSGAGWARLFPSPRNEGSDAPRRRVVRITPDGPDDHPGRTRIAGSWRISGCAAPTRRATRHLRLYAFNGSVGPARSLSATGGLPAAARGRDGCGATLAGAASRPTSTTPREDAPRWTGHWDYNPIDGQVNSYFHLWFI